MFRSLNITRGALARAYDTRLGKVALAVIALAALGVAALLRPIGDHKSSIDSLTDSRIAELKNGWVTNCTGPAFGRLLRDEDVGPGTERPIFRISDQLVLAVPKLNSPSANSIETEAHRCNKISDLPIAAYVSFVVRGGWSAGYKPDDVPTVRGHKQFRPDVVSVRIELEATSKLSADEQQRVQKLLGEWQQSDSTGTRQIGALTCFIPKRPGRIDCFGNRTDGDRDVTKLHYYQYSSTPFVLVQADYLSARYGVHVYWQAWTSDISHALDIDAAIWRSLEDWNLLNKPAARAAQP